MNLSKDKRFLNNAFNPDSKTLRKESGLKKGARFVLLFLVFFAISIPFLYFTPLKQGLGIIAAKTAQTALYLLSGIETEITILSNGNFALQNGDFTAELNEACSALVEIAVLFGIKLASFEKPFFERVKGFAAGMVLLLVFNPLRIALSIIYLDPFVHDVLFRITLIIVIVGFYGVWHYWNGILSFAGKKGKKRFNTSKS